MSKSDKVRELLDGIDNRGWPVEYAGYFHHFNAGRYYEAHDVLEQLWLLDRHGPHGNFYKGLIQFAGAFVHLQKGRIAPGLALFRLSRSYLDRYAPGLLGLDIDELLVINADWSSAIERHPAMNPLAQRPPPRLRLGIAAA